ncbi:hypothetical protein BCR42DRAFT_399664 [Absidia repens]|uniref:Galactose oxidase n=1 Tax=Absidia repens TaxID=90262 RepID=A0A1X2J0C1_9FUNG|nr:hypothetical protein BCR42DRAFT_399664 [Absidia repens]
MSQTQQRRQLHEYGSSLVAGSTVSFTSSSSNSSSGSNASTSIFSRVKRSLSSNHHAQPTQLQQSSKQHSPPTAITSFSRPHQLSPSSSTSSSNMIKNNIEGYKRMPPPPTSFAMQESFSLPGYNQENKSVDAFSSSTVTSSSTTNTMGHGEERKTAMGPRSTSDHFHYKNNGAPLITSAMTRARSTDPNTHSGKQSASLRSAVPLPTPTSMTSSFIELTTMAKKQPEKRTSLSGQGGGVQAPAPAMYWSLPSVYGKIPKPTRAHVSVVVGDLMYVFGGTDSKHCLGSLYALELDTFTWTKPKVYGDIPPPCRAHSAVAHGNNIYVFGGGDGPTYHNHFYALDTVSMTWWKPSTSGPVPSPRRAHVAVVWCDVMYIFGGGDGARALNDVCALNLKTMCWSVLETTGPKPVARGYHSGTLVGSKLIIFGGSDGHECFGDIHVFDLESQRWHPFNFEPHVPRLSHTAVCVGSYLFVTAGHDGSQYCKDLLLLNLVTMAWEVRKVYGNAPSNRGYHTMLLYDSRLFMFGGYDGKKFFNDLYVLELSSCAYLQQITNFSIDV